jgi:hypothetical protein
MGSEKKPDASKAEPKPDAKPEAKPEPAKPSDDDHDKPRSKTEPAEPAKPPTKPVERTELPEIEPPDPIAEPWPDATPQPMKPVEPARARTETVGMPTGAQFGRPPEMPKATAPPPLALGSVENPTYMPAPKDVPSGNADDPAPAPGPVPPGDSRSMRHGTEFALIYRVGTYVITRFGTVGKRGQWRVVEYPTSASASHSYAKECSRFVSEGFSDYRE